MSQRNLDRAVALFERLGNGGFDAIWDDLDPDLEWETSPNLPDAGVYRGRDRVRAFIEEQWDVVWGGIPTVEVERTFDCGADVLVFIRVQGRGSHTGIPLDVRIAQLATIRDGKLVRVKVFPDRDEALAAVGLSDAADR